MSVIYEGSPLDQYLRASEIEEDVERVMDLASETDANHEEEYGQEKTQQTEEIRNVGSGLIGSIGNELIVGWSVLLGMSLDGSPRNILERSSIEPPKMMANRKDLAEMSKYILCSSSLMGSSLPRAVEHPIEETEADREESVELPNDPSSTSFSSLSSSAYSSSSAASLNLNLNRSQRTMLSLAFILAAAFWLALGPGSLVCRLSMVAIGLLSCLYILGRSIIKRSPTFVFSSSGNAKAAVPAPRLSSSISQAQKDALMSLERLVSEAEAYDRSMNAALGSVYELDRDLPMSKDVSTSSLPNLTLRQTLLSTLSTLTHLSSEAFTNLMPFVSSKELGTLSTMYGLDVPPPLLPPTSRTDAETRPSDLDDPRTSPRLSSLRPFEITRLNTPTRSSRFPSCATSAADSIEPIERHIVDRWSSPPRAGSSRKRHSMLSFSGEEDETERRLEDTSHFTAMPKRTSRAQKRQTWSFSGGVHPRMSAHLQNSPRIRLRTQTSGTIVLDMTPSKDKGGARSASASPILPTLSPSPLAATIIPVDAQSPFLTRLARPPAMDVSADLTTCSVPLCSPNSAGSRALNELTRSCSSASASSREGSATSSTPYYLKRRSLQTLPYKTYSPSHDNSFISSTITDNADLHDSGLVDPLNRSELSTSSPSMTVSRSKEYEARMSPKRLGGGTYTPRRGPMDQVQEEKLGRREEVHKNSADLSQPRPRPTPLSFCSGHRHTLSSPSSLAYYRPRLSHSEYAEEEEETAEEERQEKDRMLVPLSHAHLLTHFFGLHANRRYTLVSLLALKKDLVDTSWEDIQTQVEVLFRGFVIAREEIGKELRIYRQQQYWAEHKDVDNEGFAPRSKTKLQERRDWIEQLRREVDLLETNLAAKAQDEFIPGGFDSSGTDGEWDSWWLDMRDELGGLIRIWERGRISMGIEIPNGLVDSIVENQSSSPPDVLAPSGMTGADEPGRELLRLDEAEQGDTELADDVALHLESQLRLPPPGREEVFIGDTAPVSQYRPPSKLSREERILLAKKERENSKQGIDGEDETSGMDDVVSELKGLMSELRRLKRPHETDLPDDETETKSDTLLTERVSYATNHHTSFSPSPPPLINRPSLPFDLPTSLIDRLSLPALSIGSSDGDDLESDDQDGSFELEFFNPEKNGSQVTITLGVDSDADTEEGDGSKVRAACSTP
ncbi:hypothetical protein [Phaffia rhodozyma]|uniref:Myosin-binding domain-containing protein n=1 Tax=Phaffia rhodozyma TaxID=264483 RepID=A0A0F7SV43_PHARH|nr:hypothetical protein [Phaffia rhodozyma]